MDYDKGRIMIEEDGMNTTVYVDGEEVFSCNDECSFDSPEDFIWGRNIQDIFYSGLRAGLMLAQEKGKE